MLHAWQAYLNEEFLEAAWDTVLGTEHAFAVTGPAGSCHSMLLQPVVRTSYSSRRIAYKTQAAPSGKVHKQHDIRDLRTKQHVRRHN